MGISSATVARPLKLAWERTLPHVNSTHIAWLVIGFGAVLRAAEYFSNAALYVDEAAIAMNIINRTLGGLFQTLDFNQAAPPGFLVLEKFAVLALGDGEYALRLIPFLFSITALLLFYAVAKRILAGWAVPVAVLFFAVSEQVIYYSAQVKQYSSDVAVTLLVVLLGLQVESKGMNATRAALLATAGVLAVWLSHPSVFVLAGVGSTLALVALKRKQMQLFWKLAGCYGLWVLSFASFYLTSLSRLSANERLEASWMKKGTFMPLLPTSFSELEWFPATFFKMFSNPVDSPFPVIAGLVFIVGCFALLRQRRAHLMMLIAPLLLTLLASGVHKYPFGRRLLLFTVPLILIVIAYGIDFLIKRARLVGLSILIVAIFQLVSPGELVPSWKRLIFFLFLSSLLIVAAGVAYFLGKEKLYAGALASMILVLLLLQPVGGAVNRMRYPSSRQDIRPALNYIGDNRQPGDLTYVYHHQLESFLYYAPKYGFGPSDYVIGTDKRDDWKDNENLAYKRELDKLHGNPRVWVLFSHVRSVNGVNEETYLLQYLSKIGKRLDEFKSGTSAGYLFDLSSNPALTSE